MQKADRLVWVARHAEPSAPGATNEALHLTAAALPVILVPPAPAAAAGELWRKTDLAACHGTLRIDPQCRPG